jgi:hypothetical protein
VDDSPLDWMPAALHISNGDGTETIVELAG